MTTVIFYNFIVLSSTFFVWVSEKISSKVGRLLFLLFAFLVVLLPSALRYDVGTDFFNYIHIYENISNYTHLEKGFYFINWFLRSIDANSQWSIALFSMIFTFTVFLGLPDKNKWLLFFVFMLLTYFISFNQIRQAIAVAFTLLSLRFFLNKKILSFVITLIIGGLFHKTAWLLIPVGLFSLVPLPKKFKCYYLPVTMIFFLLVMMFMSNVFFDIAEHILIKLELYKYANYFSSTKHFVARTDGTNLGVAIKLCLCIYFILLSKYVLRQNEKNILIIYMVFLYSLSTIFAAKIIIFGRMQSIFIPALAYSIYILWRINAYKRLNQIVIILFLLFFLSTYVKSSFGIPSSYADPKLNPYKSILTE